ncbi:hypothetical protein ACO22_06460 [Paracoccidioides brasiliensis]|uniref:RING-type E3 ubiquitin transferase n=1 Tax=Paracoccidioides brasiliensis TaxID=121759 RepID=A0A1D2J7H0_PARBR|nr:hypothetical protein ACO22_06460 [Paracoccidioides brasiliensis]
MRLAAYAGVSTALAAGVILKALHQRANFYSACVYLSQSNANLMILTNLCLMVVGFVLYGLQRLLYGPLRPIETEQLYEKAWFAVMETCLAMTTFRGDLGAWFLAMFVCLLIGKVWGWIGEGRVEILEQQPPQNPRLFHTRLTLSLILSVTFNGLLLEYAVKTVLLQARPDMMVMFGFEFAILSILSTSTAARYAISLWDIYITRQQRRAKMEERIAEIRVAREEAIQQRSDSRSEEALNNLPNEDDIDEMELDVPGWEEKGRWVFYLDLVTDFLKLVVYISFFAILFSFYGLPIHILRDVVLTMRSFGKRVVDFLRYRNATRDMNERYPDATVEEMTDADVCIICREEMEPWPPVGVPNGNGAAARPPVSDRLRPKKLPCGHILHFACLRSWLERQQNCPTCRRPVAPVVQTGIFGAPAAPPAVPGGRGNVGGVPPAQAPGANGQPGEARPRAWVFNFGPIRIGFGAGRGDLFQNLAQQIHNGDVPLPPPAANQIAGLAGPQQIGFGFGFGRPPIQQPPLLQQGLQQPLHQIPQQTTTTTQFNIHYTQAQLHQIEQQISQEINALRTAAEQLQVVRLLQIELARLRAVQANTTSANRPIPGQPPPAAIPSLPTTTPTALASSHIPYTGSQRQFTSNPQVPALSSGDNRLPEGLTLPQGWTLLPLQQVNNSGQPSTQTSTLQATNPPSSQTASTPTANHQASSMPNIFQPSNPETADWSAPSNPPPSNHQRPLFDTASIHPQFSFSTPNSGTNNVPVQPSSANGHPSEESMPAPPDWAPAASNAAINTSATAADKTTSDAGIEDNKDDDHESSDRLLSKGKSRATTVEDYIEDDA